MRNDESVCHAAARLGVFCRGFSKVHFDELKRRFYWIDEEHPGIDREEFERLAEQWLQSQQDPAKGRIACDALTPSHPCCAGWEEFNDAELGLFYEELFNKSVQIWRDAPGQDG